MRVEEDQVLAPGVVGWCETLRNGDIGLLSDVICHTRYSKRQRSSSELLILEMHFHLTEAEVQLRLHCFDVVSLAHHIAHV